eukprot:2999645-Alexandrium_andersonii.AAC.1
MRCVNGRVGSGRARALPHRRPYGLGPDPSAASTAAVRAGAGPSNVRAPRGLGVDPRAATMTAAGARSGPERCIGGRRARSNRARAVP